MNVTSPDTLARGSKLTFSVNGAQGAVGASIDVGGNEVNVRGSSKPNGTVSFCYRLPASFKGVLQVTVTDGRESTVLQIAVG
ncbi:MAG: hypothetical protein V3W41_12305 [Planctomycetota bacterium]